MYETLGSTNISMYNLLNGIAVLTVIIYNFIRLKEKRNFLSNKSAFLYEYNVKKNKKNVFTNTTFRTIIEILFISIVQYAPAMFLNSKFGSLMKTGSNYFGLILFIPLFLFPFFYYISINPFKQMDLITPAYPLALIFVKLGCFCNGCCVGFRCDWGLTNYSYYSGPRNEFPTQLVEAGLALAIFIFLVLYRKKAKEGTLFPIYLILYSLTRFFSEFTRGNENVLGIFKTYHLLCIVGVIVGMIEFIIVSKYSEKIIPVFDRPVHFAWYKEKNIVHHKKR